MVNGVNNLSNVGNIASGGVSSEKSASPSGSGSTSFADTLKKSIDEVSRLQQDATRAVEDLHTGKTQNVTSVMSAVEKADLAFKTLVSIRAKLMDAYDEIKNIQV